MQVSPEKAGSSYHNGGPFLPGDFTYSLKLGGIGIGDHGHAVVYGDPEVAGEAEYIVAKNRNGGTLRSRMRFESEFTLFSDLDEVYSAPIVNGQGFETF